MFGGWMINLIARGKLTPKTQKKLSKLFVVVNEYYKLAEQKVKLIEVLDNNLYIPSVNELRYAGYHLSKATVANTHKTATRELNKALKHCKRAIYDAIEVGITFYLEVLKLFFYDYRLVVITPIIPDLTAIKIRISEIRDFITKPRTNERVAFWEECTQLFIEIQQIAAQFENSREELNKISEQHRIESQRHRHSTILTYVGIIIAILVSVLTIIYTHE